MDNPAEITYIGKTDFRNALTRFGIKAVDRTKHMYIIGKTGTGKSTFLENLLVQDIVNGNGLAFIDPHGGSAEKMLEFIPEHRIKDVIYLNPSDTDFPIAFNPLEDTDPTARPLVVDGLMTVFKKIWPDAFSGRMEYILNNTMLALLEYPNPTLLSINRFLTDKDFRKRVVANVSDPTVKNAWDELGRWDDKRWSEATGALINKVGQFTTNPLIRNIVGQVNSTFDFRKAMDDRKILIINLSKGRIGEQNQPLFGAMLITKIYLAAMSRADLDTATQLPKVPPFYFYVDEFQNFANDSFANILSEARKYKLCLTVANQYVNQMAETIRDAVFGNMGTTVAFRVGPLDSPLLEKVFSPIFTANDLENLQFGQFYVTLQIDGMGSRPFSAQSLWPIPAEKQPFRNAVVEASRAMYARPRADVEREIIEWFGYNNKKVEPKTEGKEMTVDQKVEKKLFDRGASVGAGVQKPPATNPPQPQKTFSKQSLNQGQQKPTKLPEITALKNQKNSQNKSFKTESENPRKKIDTTAPTDDGDFSPKMEDLLNQFEQAVIINKKQDVQEIVSNAGQNNSPSIKIESSQSVSNAINLKNNQQVLLPQRKPITMHKDKSATSDTKNALFEALQKAQALKKTETLNIQEKINNNHESLGDILQKVATPTPTPTQVNSLGQTSKIIREVPEDILKKILE